MTSEKCEKFAANENSQARWLICAGPISEGKKDELLGRLQRKLGRYGSAHLPLEFSVLSLDLYLLAGPTISSIASRDSAGSTERFLETRPNKSAGRKSPPSERPARNILTESPKRKVAWKSGQ
jgi:hypothetical protein